LQYLQNICHFTGLREFSHRISIIERIRWWNRIVHHANVVASIVFSMGWRSENGL
jgi:hypothetical protein